MKHLTDYTPEQIKETVDTECKRTSLKRLIGEMATAELDLLYAQLIGNRKPTAEELINEIKEREDGITR
jgi:hypothetical protein